MNKSPNSKKSTLFIDRFGNLTAICDNVVDNIPEFGNRTIRREANIRFNNPSQVWEVLSLENEVMAEHPRRDQAVKLEKMIVNMQLLDQQLQR